MSKGVEVTIDEFEAYLHSQVASFFSYWRKKAKAAPADYPDALGASTRAVAFMEWEDQFRAWQDMQDVPQEPKL